MIEIVSTLIFIISISIVFLAGYSCGSDALPHPIPSGTRNSKKLDNILIAILIFVFLGITGYANTKKINIVPFIPLSFVSFLISSFLLGYQQGIFRNADRKTIEYQKFNNKLAIAITLSMVVGTFALLKF